MGPVFDSQLMHNKTPTNRWQQVFAGLHTKCECDIASYKLNFTQFDRFFLEGVFFTMVRQVYVPSKQNWSVPISVSD